MACNDKPSSYYHFLFIMSLEQKTDIWLNLIKQGLLVETYRLYIVDSSMKLTSANGKT